MTIDADDRDEVPAPTGVAGTGPVTVCAAGGVVLDGGSVLLVHRPRYNDWTLPKGKLEPGESWEEAALREVLEETGLRCRILAVDPFVTRYVDRRGRPKEVRYFRMEQDDGVFTANDEVDRVRWCTLADAVAWLTYDADRAVVRGVVGPAR
jgi:8-oxo-dGTP diphosphatase